MAHSLGSFIRDWWSWKRSLLLAAVIAQIAEYACLYSWLNKRNSWLWSREVSFGKRLAITSWNFQLDFYAYYKMRANIRNVHRMDLSSRKGTENYIWCKELSIPRRLLLEGQPKYLLNVKIIRLWKFTRLFWRTSFLFLLGCPQLRPIEWRSWFEESLDGFSWATCDFGKFEVFNRRQDHPSGPGHR